METKEVTHLPTLHMNGSGWNNLYDNYSKMTRALEKALDAMAEASPHERDYYVIPGSFEKARDLHYLRMRNVEEVMNSITRDLQALADQRNSR